ncbi:MAG TPA: PTS system trehalose-specific EIIBC component [Candidatus Monoglobus merdigallinarum]|uniref:PTS system trehalose-specific EIIBC component n=1 Tax=Candidatus Monoglobus merdigallinarum TaxID=2838698 RepID=A0A9D1PQC3_9FIRM|nr:PTS system trehalose-specific EIIBC component [Candidatus Monoglobus merdigallinarum]
MGKYRDECERLLKLVGGKDNIGAVSHCVTRMRFVLNDPKKADVSQIEKLPSVKGTFTQAGQFQVIIGNTVSAYYNDFTEVAGIDGVSKDAVKNAAKQNQNIVQKAMSNLAEIFAPLIPAIIVGGLILGFRNVIGEIKMLEDGTKTLIEVSQFWSGVYSFLWLIGEAIFHFLPVGIVWSITKKMGTTQMLGIVLGITLVSPQLLNAYDVATTAAADVPFWDFGFARVEMIGYQAQVLPAILAGFTLVYLEKGLRKICPSVISMIVVPFFSLLIAVILAHTVLGPIGWTIGSAISNVVNAGLASRFNWLFAAVFGFFYAPLVITGLHHMSNAIDLQLISDFGGTNLWPMIALSNIAQGSAVLAMIFLQKKDAKAKEVSIPACISCYLGVTEPAIFGVNLKYGFPFICAMIGSSAAAIVSVAFGVRAAAIGVGGLPGILSILPQYIPVFALCMLIAVAVPFILTFIVGKKKLAAEGAFEAEDVPVVAATPGAAVTAAVKDYKEGEIRAFLSGKVIKIEDVPDQVFAEKILGDGLAIEPTDNVLRAPADGEVCNVMQGSFHACGMTLDNGVELLFHIGLDTVSMHGDGFECHVEDGQRVKAGDALITFDPDKIIAAGHPTVTMMVVAGEGKTNGVKLKTGMEAAVGETVVANCI